MVSSFITLGVEVGVLVPVGKGIILCPSTPGVRKKRAAVPIRIRGNFKSVTMKHLKPILFVIRSRARLVVLVEVVGQSQLKSAQVNYAW